MFSQINNSVDQTLANRTFILLGLKKQWRTKIFEKMFLKYWHSPDKFGMDDIMFILVLN